MSLINYLPLDHVTFFNELDLRLLSRIRRCLISSKLGRSTEIIDKYPTFIFLDACGYNSNIYVCTKSCMFWEESKPIAKIKTETVLKTPPYENLPYILQVDMSEDCVIHYLNELISDRLASKFLSKKY